MSTTVDVWYIGCHSTVIDTDDEDEAIEEACDEALIEADAEEITAADVV